MKKYLTALLLTVVFTISFTGNAYAKKEKYIDNNFNFSKVSTIFIGSPQLSANTISDIKSRELNNFFFQTMQKSADNLQKQGIKVLTENDIIALIKKDSNIDMYEYFKADFKKASELFYSAIRYYADVAILTNVFSFDSRTTGTVTQSQQVVDPNSEFGKSFIQFGGAARTSTTKFVKVSCAGVRFDMLDIKSSSSTAPPVISIIDYRESKWSSDRAYKSVVESFFDELEKVFKK